MPGSTSSLAVSSVGGVAGVQSFEGQRLVAVAVRHLRPRFLHQTLQPRERHEVRVKVQTELGRAVVLHDVSLFNTAYAVQPLCQQGYTLVFRVHLGEHDR